MCPAARLFHPARSPRSHATAKLNPQCLGLTCPTNPKMLWRGEVRRYARPKPKSTGKLTSAKQIWKMAEGCRGCSDCDTAKSNFSPPLLCREGRPALTREARRCENAYLPSLKRAGGFTFRRTTDSESTPSFRGSTARPGVVPAFTLHRRLKRPCRDCTLPRRAPRRLEPGAHHRDFTLLPPSNRDNLRRCARLPPPRRPCSP